MDPPVALTIAGSDSGAGAGLQADLKTFAALGVFGTSAVTAVTAQNTAEVRGVVAIEPAFVDEQIDTVLADMSVAAVKTGMLASSATVAAVGRWAAAGRLPNLVVDPVLVASTGRELLDDRGVRAYLEHLIPRAVVVTPNTREAALLTGAPVDDLAGMIGAAHRLAELGPRVVVVTGGHLGGDAAPDVVVADGEALVLDGARIDTGNDHGTGCTLAAATAAYLARGVGALEAVRGAKAFVTVALRGSAPWRLGRGHGPLDHFGWGSGGGGSSSEGPGATSELDAPAPPHGPTRWAHAPRDAEPTSGTTPRTGPAGP
ncbi:MAG TPA: bifunctional hydroxymethylpyrimidine kinase/phosphomethylpyrimidine kinase [Acidimicrobiales bacterium]|nr:bifunctional hydroxymethylpyrimidine kinase/phosphomethylpyrimidine kinase [Acidimicrobiales bacterium]